MQNLKQIMRAQIAPQLISLRQQKGLSIQDVALQTPLSLSMINQIEQGKNLSSHHYLRLIKFYGKKLKFDLQDIK